MNALPTQLALELLPRPDRAQRWDSGATRWARDGELFEPRRHDVAPILECEARPFVERHHYSREYPAARLAYGLFRGPELVGAAVLSNPMQARVLTNPFPDLRPYAEALELGRFVLLDGVAFNAESWFLARVLRLAHADDGVRGVVSFSDPCPRRLRSGALVMPGHVGQIYQATAVRGVGHAVYAGRGTARTLTMLPDGRVLSDRATSKLRTGERGGAGLLARLVERYGAPEPLPGEPGADWLARILPAIGAWRLRHPGNHRYLFALDRGVTVRATAYAAPRSIDPEPVEVAA